MILVIFSFQYIVKKPGEPGFLFVFGYQPAFCFSFPWLIWISWGGIGQTLSLAGSKFLACHATDPSAACNGWAYTDR